MEFWRKRVRRQRLLGAAATVMLITAICSPTRAQAPDSLRQALCTEIRNTFQCARAIEQHQLAAGAAAARVGDTLAITLAGGESLELIDQGEVAETIRYSYGDFFAQIGYHFLHVQYYEGGGYLLVNAVSGSAQVVFGEPIVSPDGARLITTSLDLIAEFDPNGIQIWRLTSDSLVLEHQATPDDWGPAAARWTGPNAVDVAMGYVETATFPDAVVRDTLHLRLEDGRWVSEGRAP